MGLYDHNRFFHVHLCIPSRRSKTSYHLWVESQAVWWIWKGIQFTGRDLFSEREDYVSVATVKSNHVMMIGLQDTLQGMGFSFFFFILIIMQVTTFCHNVTFEVVSVAKLITITLLIHIKNYRWFIEHKNIIPKAIVLSFDFIAHKSIINCSHPYLMAQKRMRSISMTM